MNPGFLILIILAGLALLVFFIWRNAKDEKDLENEINNDYPKPRDDERDPEPEEVLK